MSPPTNWRRLFLGLALGLCLASSLSAEAVEAAPPVRTIGFWEPLRDAEGVLQARAAWPELLEREVQWYARCPRRNGFPIFVAATFMGGDYAPLPRKDFIPATQCATGILSYLAYHRYTGGKRPELLEMARCFGDYLVEQALTPDEGRYPRFPRSTGLALHFPQPADCGSQEDRPHEIQPDKGGLAAFALLKLQQATGEARYGRHALHIARVLAANRRVGDAGRSPWPFRADYRSGEGRGEVSANMTYILRTWDELLSAGHAEFAAPREDLAKWIFGYQVPSAAGTGSLWVNFFEDHDSEGNRNAWAPLHLARYLLEARESLSPRWREKARLLIEFVNRNFIRLYAGTVICVEQDRDSHPWLGILSTYAAVLAEYGKATGSTEYRSLARQALVLCQYSVNDYGAPGDALDHPEPGGWQEDAHTDKLHNLVRTLEACPEWGK